MVKRIVKVEVWRVPSPIERDCAYCLLPRSNQAQFEVHFLFTVELYPGKRIAERLTGQTFGTYVKEKDPATPEYGKNQHWR